jgi:hypothetical protein
MKTNSIKSCEDCPFPRWNGYHHPTEKECGCPGDTKADNNTIVFSCASGWWYKTPPKFCPLRVGGGVRFLVEESVEVGK